MLPLGLFLLFSSAPIIQARPSPAPSETSNPGIKWELCPDDAFPSADPATKLECGTLRVPLDYTETKTGTKEIELELLRIPAPKQPKKGSIQFNFGGPGGPARSGLAERAPLFQKKSGGVYDLIAFDPRGVSKALPFVCTKDEFLIGQVLAETRSGNETENSLRRLWARGEVDGTICQQQGNANETAEFVGTAFVAQDMLRVAEAVDEDGLLRFWGFSYGTTLGATLAAMFPDKIDRMIIDGVQNPHEYYNAHADFEEWADADKAFSYFFQSCIEDGPELCPLATLNKSAKELEQDHWTFFEHLRNNPIPAGTMMFGINGLKGFIMNSLKDTQDWPVLAKQLMALLYGSEAEKVAVATALTAMPPDTPPNLGTVPPFWSIHCGDRFPRAKKFEEVAPVFEKLKDISKLQGGPIAGTTAHCAQWPWHAKESYKGDFCVKTKEPVLVMSNSIDAHTPLRSARNVSSGLHGSGLLEVNGIGHCTRSVPSLCAAKHLIAYWVNGTLPEKGTVCEADARPWENSTWEDTLDRLNGESKPVRLF